MLPSDMSSEPDRVQFLKNRFGSSGEVMSGSVTISASGTPARLKSTRVLPLASSCSSCPRPPRGGFALCRSSG